jgi:hypothetical protein
MNSHLLLLTNHISSPQATNFEFQTSTSLTPTALPQLQLNKRLTSSNLVFPPASLQLLAVTDMAVQATGSDWSTVENVLTSHDSGASTTLHDSSANMTDHPTDAATTSEQPDHEFSVQSHADSPKNSDHEEAMLAFAAYDANEERRIKAHLGHVTVRRHFSALPAPMSSFEADLLAPAPTRRWERMQAVEAEYQVGVGSIGRNATGFLDLSAELRNIVYGYALVFPDNKCDFYGTWSRSGESGESGFRPAVGILATCKQIHEEASAVLYGANTFRCDSVAEDDWEQFASTLGRNLRHIRTLEHSNSTPATPRYHLRRNARYHEASSRRRLNYLFRLQGFHEANLVKLKIVLELYVGPSELVTAIRGFVGAQFKKRKAEACEKDKLRRQTTKVPVGRQQAGELLVREQAVAILDMLEIRFRVDVPRDPFPYDPYDIYYIVMNRFSQAALQEQELEADHKTSQVYDGLAAMLGLIGRQQTLEETGAYDWRAARK